MQRDPPVCAGDGRDKMVVAACCEGGRGIERPVLLVFKCVGEWGCGGTAGRDWEVRMRARSEAWFGW